MQIHEGQPVLIRGRPLTEARTTMILVHGRGASAESILTLVPELNQPEFAYLAPQAAGGSWYPYSFLEPVERNQPYLSSALARINDLVQQVNEAGISTDKIMLLGFSQGACLTLEFVARSAQRYGGVIGFSGGLIGPDGTPRDYPRSLDGTPVFLGCSDVDFHIPKARVDETAVVLERMGGKVTKRIYPSMGHTINQDEIDFVTGMMSALVSSINEEKPE